MGFPRGSAVKSPPAKAGNTSSIPGSGRSPVEGSGNPPQYSCLENPMTRGAWWATVRGIVEELNMIYQPNICELGIISRGCED